MKFFKHIFWLLLLIISINLSFGQKKEVNAKIMVTTRAKKKSILLRWAVTTPAAWKISNEYGFIIERYTVSKSGHFYNGREKVVLAPGSVKARIKGDFGKDTIEKSTLSPYPIKPRPLADWETIAKKDNYAAVIAQAIYGEDFELSSEENKGVAKIVNKSNELEQRYTMSLYAADNSFEAAKFAGWGWEDKNVKTNEKYLYRIISAVPKSQMVIDSGYVFVGTADHQPLPKPTDISSIFGDKSVMLSWNYNILRSYYNSYFVEKSVDGGKNFKPLSDLPVTNFNEKENKPSDKIYFIDSLKDNNIDFQYRIKGISAFGEVGPPSDPISGKGKKILAFIPGITSRNINKKGVLQLKWEFDETGNDLIKGFTLNQSQSENGTYKTVVENITASQRTIEFDKLYAANYFTITAVAKNGQSQTSFPVLVQTVDSMPPAAPIGISATIDTNGIVKLIWNQNAEQDLLGYKIFRANNLKEEMAVITDSVINTNNFYDTVSIKTLNNKLYYTVAALDQRYNQSATSTIIEVSKPDRIPPSSPLFANYKIENEAVHLTWTNSPDEDVATHNLYKKIENENWQLVQQFSDTTQNYVDNKVASGKNYQYKIIAQDKSGLESLPAAPLNINIPSNPSDINIRSIDSYVDRNKRYIEISWRDNLKEVEEYQLYKAVKGKPLTLWKITKSEEQKSIIDQDIAINSEYEYGIRPLLKNGALGKYKSLIVKY